MKKIDSKFALNFLVINLCFFLHLSASSTCLTYEQLKSWVPVCGKYESMMKSAENACATAGNIDRCIQIKMQGQNYHAQCMLVDFNMTYVQMDKEAKKPFGTSCREANPPKQMPYNFSIQDIGK
jgi:hypothetical protein